MLLYGAAEILPFWTTRRGFLIAGEASSLCMCVCVVRGLLLVEPQSQFNRYVGHGVRVLCMQSAASCLQLLILGRHEDCSVHCGGSYHVFIDLSPIGGEKSSFEVCFLVRVVSWLHNLYGEYFHFLNYDYHYSRKDCM